MSKLSDNDSSSDSSSEFLVPIDKINLNSSFFDPIKNKTNTRKVLISSENSENSDEDFDYANDNNVSTADLLSEVLKNLKNEANETVKINNSPSEASTSKEVLNNSSNVNLSEEISNLLQQGESTATQSLQDNDGIQIENCKPETKTEYAIPEKGVEIHLPGQNLFDWKKKKQQDLQKLLQSKINQRIRSTQVFIHKVGLLVWLTHGFYLNKLANDSELLGTALSLVSSNNYPKGRIDLKYLEKFTKWFIKMFKICEEHKEVVYSKDLLMKRLIDKNIYNYIELVLLYIITMRGMGINCRLVISLYPPPLKPSSEKLFKISTNNTNNANQETIEEKRVSNKQIMKFMKTTQVKGKVDKTKSKYAKSISPTKIIPDNSKEASKVASLKAKKKAALVLKQEKSTCLSVEETKPDKSCKEIMKTKINKKIAVKNIKLSCNDAQTDIVDESNLTIARKLRSRVIKGTEITRNNNNKEKLISKLTNIESSSKRRYSSSSEARSDEGNDFSTDDEYTEKKPKSKIKKKKTACQTFTKELENQTRKQRKLLSSDDEVEVESFFHAWIEVYIESEENWISVNVMDQKIHCASEIYTKAKKPVLYIVAWNPAGTLKDVTRRYCPHWLTNTRKKRVDEKWWHDTLSSWKEKKTTISKAEDEAFLQSELEQPLPKTISECKGHPLYVLTRHLLKFEALYPPDAVPLGHLKTGEAIYSRHCVYTLYSRETWVRKAQVVKPAQEAYKIVKSMPKYDKLSGMKIKDQPLELFGKWQTTPYVPPEAKDGKVPRNEYGNVDLFRMCMLPKGTVYLNHQNIGQVNDLVTLKSTNKTVSLFNDADPCYTSIANVVEFDDSASCIASPALSNNITAVPALNRVARKLNIDCAPACVGFNFGCRGALPAFEGFVVCEEFEDTLRDAWEQEQIESEKRTKEKREKRIYGNWKKLIKGLLIRKKLTAKYNFCDEENLNRNTEKVKNVTNTKKQTITTSKTTTKMLKRSKQDSTNTKKKIKK